MIKIADNLKGKALLLWEIAAVFDLEPEDLAPFVGVPVARIYEWFGGGEPPTEDEEAKILAAHDKIEAAYPEPAVRLRGSTEMVGAWWRKRKHEPTPGETAADEAALKAEDELLARIAEAGAKLKASVSGPEAEQLGEAWEGFVRVARAMHERKINFRI